MKKVILAMSFSWLFTLESQAQHNSAAPGRQSAQYSKTLIPWKGHELTWKDFRGEEPDQDTLAYQIRVMARPVNQRRKIDGIVYEYPAYDTYLNAEECWVRPSRRDETMLQFLQASFDLWELQSRKAAIDHALSNDASMDEIHDYYSRMFDKRLRQEKNLSDSCKNQQAVERFAADVRDELAHTEFAPAEYARTLKPGIGLYYDLGLDAHLPSTAYVSSAPIGFNLGLGILHKHSLFGLDMSMDALCKCRKAIVTNEGTIQEDERLMVGEIKFVYGYQAKRSGRLQLTPFAGLGYRNYSGGQKDPQFQHSRKDDRLENTGISLGIGLMTDIMLHRKFWLGGMEGGNQYNATILRFKPYFSMTHFSSDMGWVPSLNLAITFTQLYHSLK